MELLEARLSSLSVSGRSAPRDPVYLLDLSIAPPPGDTVVASCSDFTLHLHNKQTLRLLQSYGGHKSPISNVKFTHKSANTFYSASLDGTVRLWDVRCPGKESDQVFRSDPVHSFSSFDLSCDNSLLCAGTEQINHEDSFLVFWDARKPGSALLGVYSESHSDDITQVLFHPTDKDRLASGSMDGLVNVFDLTKGSEEDALVATCNSESSVSALCWLGGEQGSGQVRQEQTRLLCVSHDEGLKLWDLESLETEGELTVYSTQDARTTIGHSSSADSVLDYLIGGCWLDSEGQLLVVGGSVGGDIHLFTCDKSGLNLVRTLRTGHSSTVRSFGFDSQSLSLFTGGEDGVLLRWSPDERSGGVAEGEVGSSRQEQSRVKPESLKSESVMRLKSRPHKKHKFNRDKKVT
ncbi:hypothetical protein NQD34_016633 [Periophthalmus magnuspinnatus]|nr:hypothetical protein NQD34_016633 [Periophthalmus magnuspinnatus]